MNACQLCGAWIASMSTHVCDPAVRERYQADEAKRRAAYLASLCDCGESKSDHIEVTSGVFSTALICPSSLFRQGSKESVT
jgi:hypothetical protein